MESISFLKERLSWLVKEIPYIRCEYFFREIDNTHIVRVFSRKNLNDDEKFIELENRITFEFIEKFPYENVFFISPDSILLEDDRFIGEFIGSLYDSISNTHIALKSKTFEDFSFSSLSVDIKDVYNTINSSKNIGEKEWELYEATKSNDEFPYALAS